MIPSILPVSLMQTRRRWYPLSYLYPSCWQGGYDTLCIFSISRAGMEEMTPFVIPVSLMLGRRRWHPLYPPCRQPPPAWLDLTLDSSMYKLHARVFSSFLQQVLMVFLYICCVYFNGFSICMLWQLLWDTELLLFLFVHRTPGIPQFTYSLSIVP